MIRIQPATSVVSQLWPGGALHLPNITDEIILGGERQGLSDNSSFVSYKPRLMGALSNPDGILLPTALTGTARQLVQYHEHLGLSCFSAGRIFPIPRSDGSFSQAAIRSAHELRATFAATSPKSRSLLPFIQSENAKRMADILELETDATPQATDWANHKGFAYEELKKRGILVPRGGWTHSEDEAHALYSTLKTHGTETIYAKLARAASGQGVWEIKSESDWGSFIRDSRVQLQLRDAALGVRLDEGREPSLLPNVMIYVGRTPEKDRWITSSQQLLAKKQPTDEKPTIHIGNIGPLPAELEDLLAEPAQQVADWLRSIGAYGLCGIDFLLEKMPMGAYEAYWLENNFRVNGNNGASFIALGRGAKTWAAHNGTVVPKGTTLGDYAQYLESSGVHYSRDSGTGIYVVNSATMEFGKMQIGVIANDVEQVKRLLAFAAMTVSG